MDSGVIIAVVSLAVSIVSLLFAYSQVRVAAKTTKSEIAITLVDQLYSDPTVRALLQKVYDRKLKLQVGDEGYLALVSPEKGEMVDVTDDVDLLLNRFQIVGHLLSIGVLNLRDIQGMRYEVIRLGRDGAIRRYLGFLASDYQELSGVRHDHFGYFKKLYTAFEYDSDALASWGRDTIAWRDG